MTKYEELKKVICEALPRLQTKNGAFTFYQEPVLSDILEWNNIVQGTYTKAIIYKWELSKPLLKDQSEELIDYLISIKSQS